MSGVDVPYHLRPNKYVDRQIFIDLLHRLDRVRPLSRSVYVIKVGSGDVQINLHWGKQLESGEVVLASDPLHKTVNPYLFRIEEAIACWKRITAPVLLVSGKQSDIPGRMKDTPEQFAERKGAFRDRREVELDDCGHMMHHDQPERLARILEDFLGPA